MTSFSPATSGSTRRPSTSSGWWSAGGLRVEHELVEEVFDRGAQQLDTAARAARGQCPGRRRQRLHLPARARARSRARRPAAGGADPLPRALRRGARKREKPADITEIAYHWHAANNHGKAFPATIAAMRSASQAYAYATAAQMGERALEIWDAIDDAEAVAGMPRSTLMGKVAAYLHTAGEPERALATINLAISIGDVQGPDLARHLMLKAQCLHNIAKLGAIPLLKEALELVPPGVDETLAGDDPLPARGALHDRRRAARRRRDGHPGARARTRARRSRGGVRRIQHPWRCPGASWRRRGAVSLTSSGPRSSPQGNSDALLRFRVNYSDMLNLLGPLRRVRRSRRRRARPLARAGRRAQLGSHPGVEHDRSAVRARRVGARQPPARPRDRAVSAFDVPGLPAAVQGLVDALARRDRGRRADVQALEPAHDRAGRGGGPDPAPVRPAGRRARACPGRRGHGVGPSVPRDRRRLPLAARAARSRSTPRPLARWPVCARTRDTEVDVDDAEKRLRASAARPTRSGRRRLSGPPWSTPSSADRPRTGDDAAAWQRALDGAEALPAQVGPYLLLRLAMAQHAAGSARPSRSTTLEQTIEAANTLGAGLITDAGACLRPACRAAARRGARAVTRPARSSSPRVSSRCWT